VTCVDITRYIYRIERAFLEKNFRGALYYSRQVERTLDKLPSRAQGRSL
jgi:hypothetical protein